MTFRCIVALGLTALLGACATMSPDRGPARAMTIVAFGDSTTAPRTVDGGELRIYADILRDTLPEAKVINGGVGGNSTADGRARFASDVLSKNPGLAIIQFGLNDSCIDLWDGKTEPRVSKSDYLANLRYFVESLRGQDCEVILMTANPMRWTEPLLKLYGRAPYDVSDPWGFNVTNGDYAEGVRTLAKELDVPLVDVYARFVEYSNQPGQAAEDLLLDGMHPNAKGHGLIADWILETMTRLK